MAKRTPERRTRRTRRDPAGDKSSWSPGLAPLPKDAVDAANTEIWWSYTDDSKVRAVAVVDRKKRLGGIGPRRPGTHDAGASSSDWLQPEAPAGSSKPANLTPEGVFGHFISAGFANEHELKNALVQFARIKGCDWARAMLFAFSEKEERQVRAEAERRAAGRAEA